MPALPRRWIERLRHAAAIGAYFALVGLLPSCAKNPMDPGWPPPGSPGLVDVDPVYSRDGRFIAFRRRSPSSDGPPGLYIVPSAGGPVRYLVPGDLFFPTQMRFSPDSRKIVYNAGLQLYAVDVGTGIYSRLPIPEELAFYPDWSPDGRFIAYASQGIRLLDLDTGETRLVRANPVNAEGDAYGGISPLWSPDGEQIAIIQVLAHEARIALIGPADESYRVIAATGNHLVTYDILHWYVRPSRGMEGVAFHQVTGPEGGYYYGNREGSHLRRFEHRFRVHSAFSPDGEWIVKTGIDPVDSVGVLFVERVDDVTGATRRQLTHWDPPGAAP